MFSKLETRLGSHAGFHRAALRYSARMCTTVTALSQISLIHRELLLHGRNAARFSQQRKSCISNVSLGKFLTPRLGDNWRIPKACFSSQNASSSAPSSIATDGFPGSLTKQTAKELVSKLTSDERNLFLTALQECKSVEEKAELEGQLAAFRWRSKFGRPVKVPTLGDVDPTGTYCPVPEDWFHKKYVEKVPEPSTKDLVFVAISNAIPFIGFGFLDNFIMILAGDQIELMLSSRFPISTMAAAALGNTVSDVIGIGSVHYVELFAQKVGFTPPKLSPIQLNFPKTRLAANVGRVCGVTIGCLIGMTPIPIVALFRG